jgi:hypothetical protein
MGCIPDPGCYSILAQNQIKIEITDLEAGKPPKRPEEGTDYRESPENAVKLWLSRLGNYLAHTALSISDSKCYLSHCSYLLSDFSHQISSGNSRNSPKDINSMNGSGQTGTLTGIFMVSKIIHSCYATYCDSQAIIQA